MNLLVIIHCGGKTFNGSDILISDLFKSYPLGIRSEILSKSDGIVSDFDVCVRLARRC